jgi:ankyrin repeat protein
MDDNRNTSLHHACRNVSLDGNLEILNLLITNDVDILALHETTELHHANGADVSAANKYGDSSLHHACRNGEFGVVKFLVVNGADVSAKNVNGSTALYHACDNGNLELVEFLVVNGADVSDVDRYGDTPLHHACNGDDFEVFKFLADNGADFLAVNGDGDTPLQLLEGGREEIEEYVSTLNFGVKPPKR